MTEPTPPPRTGRWRQAIYATMPLLLLLLCLGLIQLLPEGRVGSTAVSPPSPLANPTGAIGQAGAGLATATPPNPTATAVATPTPTFTPTPWPTLPPEARIELLGPPDGSVLPSSAPISLFWTWPMALREGEVFVVYLLLEDEERPFPPLDEPNMGNGYQWQLQPADLAGLSGELRWQIRLERSADGNPLLISDTRTLRLLASP